jgi:hypothetical protein
MTLTVVRFVDGDDCVYVTVLLYHQQYHKLSQS